MTADIDKEYYHFVKYTERKYRNYYQKELKKADKFVQKEIKDEHQQKWREFCETHYAEYGSISTCKKSKTNEIRLLIVLRVILIE